MGSITTGIGLISGINTGQLIDSLIALESRPKAHLQQRIVSLNAQRTALLDINARLLNLKNASKSFRLDNIFKSALATSNNSDVLTATASASAQPGTFQFIVKQLVATSQKLSHGFADKTNTPLGLTSMSFEFGKGRLDADRPLEQLNGGGGVQRGKIRITDRSGAQATIDLTDVTTLNEVMARINGAASVSVNVKVDGDRLVVADTSGGGGSLTIANVDGKTTATDLGIAGSVAGTTLTGAVINKLGSSSALKSLNDGNGVLVRNNVTDFTITARDGTVLSIDLGQFNQPITNATLLADLNNGAGVTIGPNSENPDFKIIDRNGDEHEINLHGVTTVGGVIARIATATSGKVTMSVHADGKRLVLTDTTGGSQNLRVVGAGVNNNKTAQDLGILNVTGVAANTLEGAIIPNTITSPAASTLGEVINRINNAEGNNGKIAASIAPDGVSLQIDDTTGGLGNLIIRSSAANPTVAAALGIETAQAGVVTSTINGQRLIASLGSVLVNNINGGRGLDGATSITITDRNGMQVIVSGLDAHQSLAEIINAINTQAAGAGVDISVGLNSAGNGLQVTDDSGGSGNLIISGDAADALGLTANVAASVKRGSNLQHRYISEASLLSELNYGRGVGTGSFRITDALGQSAVVNVGADSTTLSDIIANINSRPIAVKARLNDTGDGLIIESDLEPGQNPFTKIKVEAVSGTTAKDLNILGTSGTIENASINGSYERTVTFAESDTLSKVVSKINAAGIPVTASIINTGFGAAPFRLNFTSGISGSAGEMLIDSGDIDLGLTTLTKGQDAKVFFGGSESEGGFLITSATNSITNVLEGVTINLHKASDAPVSLTVERDTQKIADAAKQFVAAFNDATARIRQYDFYDADTQRRGPLLGNPTSARVREALYALVQRRAEGVTTQYQFLRDVGITIGSEARLLIDEAKFMAAYENDPQAVENLFAAFQASPTVSEEILPGVTVQNPQQNVTVRGIGELFDQLLHGLTNSLDGAMTLADKGLQEQIDLSTRRIAELDRRLEAKRQRLQAQFAAMEAALAKLQAQGNALGALASNVLLSQAGATGAR